MYRKTRNYENHEEKRLKSQYFCNLINESSSDGARMWKTLKQVFPNSKANKDVQAIKFKRKLFTKLVDIVEIFNKHFSTIGHKLGQAFSKTTDAAIITSRTDSRFSLVTVSERFVCDQLLRLKPNKAIGLDKISARLLKDGASVIAPIIRNIINLSFESGHFPSSWKSAKVTALFKSGEATDCNNYRPISVLPTISKIVERAAHTQSGARGKLRVRCCSLLMTFSTTWSMVR